MLSLKLSKTLISIGECKIVELITATVTGTNLEIYTSQATTTWQIYNGQLVTLNFTRNHIPFEQLAVIERNKDYANLYTKYV